MRRLLPPPLWCVRALLAGVNPPSDLESECVCAVKCPEDQVLSGASIWSRRGGGAGGRGGGEPPMWENKRLLRRTQIKRSCSRFSSGA